jgi:hypothetical protein
MNCHDARELITEYLDGELSADETLHLKEHLASCDACDRELSEQRQLIERVKALPRVPAPHGLEGAIRDAIARETADQTGRGPWIRRYGAMAASIVIVICAGIIWMKSRSGSEERRRPAREEYGAEAVDTRRAKTSAKAETEVPTEPLPGPREAEATVQPAAAAVADRQLFDLIIEADDAQRCADELAAFLREQGGEIVTRVSARHSVVVADLGGVRERGTRGITGERQSVTGRRSDVITRVIESGRFRMYKPGAGATWAMVQANGNLLDRKLGAADVPRTMLEAEAGRAEDAGREEPKAAPGPLLAVLIVEPERLGRTIPGDAPEGEAVESVPEGSQSPED